MEEVQSMVARLMGDGTSFQKMLEDARSATLSVTGIVESAGKRIEAVNQSLNRFAKGAFDALAFVGIGGSIAGAFSSFSEVEQTTLRLGAAIESSGRNAKTVTADYQEYAASVASTTLMTQNSTMSLLAKIELLGLEGKAAKEAAHNAISIAAITGGDPVSAARTAVLLAEGDKTRVARQLGISRQVKDDAELNEAIAKRLAAGWKVAQDQTQTASGQLQKLGSSLKSVTVDIGGMIASAILPLIKWVKEGVDWFKALDPATQKVIIGFVAVGAVIKSWDTILMVVVPVIGLLTGPLKLVATVLTSLSGLWGVAFAGAAIVIGILVDKAGGLAATWTLVKESAIQAWDWTKAKIDQFVKWVTPILEKVKETGLKVWEATKEKALEVWEWLKGKYEEFSAVASVSWEKVKQSIGPFLEKLKEVGAVILSYILPTVAVFAAGVVLVWNWLSSKYDQFLGASTGLWERVKEAVAPFLEKVKEIGLIVSSYVLPLLVGFAAGAVLAWHVLTSAAENAASFVVGAWNTLTTVAKYSATIIVGAWDFVASAFVGLRSSVSAITDPLLDLGRSTLGPLLGSAESAVSTFGLLAGAIAVTLIAVKVGIVVFSLFTGVLYALKIPQILSVVAWVAWTGAVLLAKGVVALYNVQLALWTALMIPSVGGTILQKVATFLLTIAVEGLNLSLALLNVEWLALIGTGVAVVGMIAALNVAITYLGSFVTGVYKGMSSLVNVITNFPTNTGPIKALSDIFGEWGSILKEVIELAKTDMPAAWEVLSAGGLLAVSQIKDVFPPLWNSIKTGVAAIADYIRITFKFAFDQAADDAVYAMRRMSATAMGIFTGETFYGDPASDIKKEQERQAQGAKETREMLARTLGKQLEGAANQFDKEYKESPATKAARENYQKSLDAGKGLKFAKEGWGDEAMFEGWKPKDPAVEKAKRDAEALGNGIGEKMGKGFKAGAGKFDAALLGSTEAMQRIQNARDAMADDKLVKTNEKEVAKANKPLGSTGLPTPPDAEKWEKEGWDEYLNRVWPKSADDTDRTEAQEYFRRQMLGGTAEGARGGIIPGIRVPDSKIDDDDRMGNTGGGDYGDTRRESAEAERKKVLEDIRNILKDIRDKPVEDKEPIEVEEADL